MKGSSAEIIVLSSNALRTLAAAVLSILALRPYLGGLCTRLSAAFVCRIRMRSAVTCRVHPVTRLKSTALAAPVAPRAHARTAGRTAAGLPRPRRCGGASRAPVNSALLLQSNTDRSRPRSAQCHALMPRSTCRPIVGVFIKLHPRTLTSQLPSAFTPRHPPVDCIFRHVCPLLDVLETSTVINIGALLHRVRTCRVRSMHVVIDDGADL